MRLGRRAARLRDALLTFLLTPCLIGCQPISSNADGAAVEEFLSQLTRNELLAELDGLGANDTQRKLGGELLAEGQIAHCVREDLSSFALDLHREMAARQSLFERLFVSPDERWLDPQDKPLNALRAGEASRIYHKFLDARPTPVKVKRMKQEWLPPGGKLVKDGSSCLRTTSYSMPEVDGRYAIVEVGFVCGSLCGSGELHLYERRDTRWALIARMKTWIA